MAGFDILARSLSETAVQDLGQTLSSSEKYPLHRYFVEEGKVELSVLLWQTLEPVVRQFTYRAMETLLEEMVGAASQETPTNTLARPHRKRKNLPHKMRRPLVVAQKNHAATIENLFVSLGIEQKPTRQMDVLKAIVERSAGGRYYLDLFVSALEQEARLSDEVIRNRKVRFIKACKRELRHRERSAS